MSKKLTPKQQKFVQEYLIDLNATQAAIRSGYSEKTAFSIGVENLKKPLIQNAISQAMEKRSKRTEISQDRVLEELARIAFGDLKDVASWGTGGLILKSSEQLTPEQSATIAEISETTTLTGGNTRIKRHDKVKALELLMRHMGMLKDKMELTGKDGMPLNPLTIVVDFGEAE